MDELVRKGGRVIHTGSWETGRHPIYELEINGKRLAVINPRVGASISAAMLELMIVLGSRKFIACGGAGALDSTIAFDHIVGTSAAIPAQGTSCHYIPRRSRVARHTLAL